MKRSLAENHLRCGYPLVFERDKDGAGHFCINGHYVAEAQARSLIYEFGLIPNKDVMFDLDPQTWRLPLP